MATTREMNFFDLGNTTEPWKSIHEGLFTSNGGELGLGMWQNPFDNAI